MNQLPSAIVFDWDECLVTQGSLIKNLTEKYLKKFLSPAEYEKHKNTEVVTGQSMRTVFPRLFGQERWQGIQKQFFESFAEVHLQHLTLKESARDICQFAEKHIPFRAIVSNKKGQFLRLETDTLDLGQYFHQIIGAGDAEHDKPNLAPMKLAMDASTLPYDQNSGYGHNVLFVGDRISDWQVAQAAQCSFAYIGSHPQTIPKENHPVYYFSNIAELLIYLAAILLRANNHWSDAQLTDKFGDLSPRIYKRYRKKNGETMLIMDAHRQPDSVKKFIAIRDHLNNLGYSVPKISAKDGEHSLLIVEDFGDNSFDRIIAKSPKTQTKLYSLAIDFLINLHQRPTQEVAPENSISHYSDEIYLQRANLLWQWSLPLSKGDKLDQPAIEEYQTIWKTLLSYARKVPESLVLRDFSCRNLFFLDNRRGLDQCGLIDFQDALRGPVTEDLLSILSSTRVDLPHSFRQCMMDRYLEAFPNLDRDIFANSWTVLSIHRHFRIIGLYSRAILRGDKIGMEKYLPKVYLAARECLNHPLLANLQNWFKKYMPDPSKLSNF